MMPLVVLFNHLSPSRRRRQYYFLAICRQLGRQSILPADWHSVVGVSLAEFSAFLSGRKSPPGHLARVAADVYRVPAPSRFYLYGPAVLFTIVVAIPAAALLHWR